MFQKLGYRIVRESGHLILSNGERRLVIPRHDQINAITMGAIARDAGLTPSSSASCSEGRQTYREQESAPASTNRLVWFCSAHLSVRHKKRLNPVLVAPRLS